MGTNKERDEAEISERDTDKTAVNVASIETGTTPSTLRLFSHKE